MKSLVELYLAHKHSRESWDPKQALLGRDRRVFQRVPVEIPCKMDNPLFGLEAQGSATNLSLGGMSLVSTVAWPEGSRIRVTFGQLVMQGLIVYRRDVTLSNPECRYGIKFQRTGIKDLLKLRKMLQDNYKGPLAVY